MFAYLVATRRSLFRIDWVQICTSFRFGCVPQRGHGISIYPRNLGQHVSFSWFKQPVFFAFSLCDLVRFYAHSVITVNLTLVNNELSRAVSAWWWSHQPPSLGPSGKRGYEASFAFTLVKPSLASMGPTTNPTSRIS